MSGGAGAPAGGARADGLWAGRLVGRVSAACGLLLLLIFIAMRLSTTVLRTFAFVPFFDQKTRWDAPGLMAAHLIAALLLLAVGLLLLRRHRLAPWAFLAGGWGGLVCVVLALWPGDNLRREAGLALRMAERRGLAAPGTTFFDLVWQQVTPGMIAGAALFLLLWLGLLLLGTAHVLRRRGQYRG